MHPLRQRLAGEQIKRLPPRGAWPTGCGERREVVWHGGDFVTLQIRQEGNNANATRKWRRASMWQGAERHWIRRKSRQSTVGSDARATGRKMHAARDLGGWRGWGLGSPGWRLGPCRRDIRRHAPVQTSEGRRVVRLLQLEPRDESVKAEIGPSAGSHGSCAVDIRAQKPRGGWTAGDVQPGGR